MEEKLYNKINKRGSRGEAAWKRKTGRIEKRAG